MDVAAHNFLENKLVKAQIQIYGYGNILLEINFRMMGRYDEAVRLALEKENIEYAKQIASRLDDDIPDVADMRKKVWTQVIIKIPKLSSDCPKTCGPRKDSRSREIIKRIWWNS